MANLSNVPVSLLWAKTSTVTTHIKTENTVTPDFDLFRC